MRGQFTLFDQLLNEPEEINATPVNTSRGRSKELIAVRDRKLLYRFYYYAKIQRRQYTDILAQLSLEFDLSEPRIIVCLSENRPELKDIFEAKPSLKDLEKRYPWLLWGGKSSQN